MILDATAGNRVVYREKNPKHIIFIDIQLKLERKPTIFADNRVTPFKNDVFDTIIYDPPHAWNYKSVFFGFPDLKTHKTNHPNDNRAYPTYYGMEIYPSKSALLKSIYVAQKEFQRILKDDGLLWFNWSELKIPLYSILAIFGESWQVIFRHRVKSKNQQKGTYANYWVCLQQGKDIQKRLFER